jgi:deoxycytidylate deaminase
MNKIIHNLISNIDIDKRNHISSPSKHQHFSGIYKNGKRLYQGCNHLRNSYNGSCICYSTHAEMDVLYKVLKSYKVQPFKDIVDLSDHVIVVVRFSRDGHIINSRPCNQCLDTMSKYRIKKIMYSTDEGTFKTDRPRAMEKMHTTSGWKTFMQTKVA